MIPGFNRSCYIFKAESPLNQSKYIIKMYPYNNDKSLSLLYLNEKRFNWFGHPNLVTIIDTIDEYTLQYENETIEGSCIIFKSEEGGDIKSFFKTENLHLTEPIARTYFY